MTLLLHGVILASYNSPSFPFANTDSSKQQFSTCNNNEGYLPLSPHQILIHFSSHSCFGFDSYSSPIYSSHNITKQLHVLRKALKCQKYNFMTNAQLKKTERTSRIICIKRNYMSANIQHYYACIYLIEKCSVRGSLILGRHQLKCMVCFFLYLLIQENKQMKCVPN